MQGFAETARRARTEKGISLRELASQLGLSPIYVSDMETGRRNPPSVDIATKWAAALELPPEEFVTSALMDAPAIKFDLVGKPQKAREAITLLARTWEALTEEQQEQLVNQISGLAKDNE